MTESRRLVIAGTRSMDVMPVRMNPVWVDAERPALCFVESWQDGALRAEPIERERVDDEVEQGYWQAIEPPLPYRPGHLLARFEADRPAEYLPPDAMGRRFDSAFRDALRFAAKAIDDGVDDEAVERVYRAARCQPADAISAVLCIAVREARGKHADEALTALVDTLARPPEQMKAAITRVEQGRLYAPFRPLVQRSKHLERYRAAHHATRPPAPGFLDRFARDPGFIDDIHTIDHRVADTHWIAA